MAPCTSILLLISCVTSFRNPKRQKTPSIASTNSFFYCTHGVNVKNYGADNHMFDSNLLQKSFIASGQVISFSGVNAHHQNGADERKNGCIANLACNMLFHAMISWLSHASTNLWPFSIKHDIDLHDDAPSNSGFSPLDIFTGLKSSF